LISTAKGNSGGKARSANRNTSITGKGNGSERGKEMKTIYFQKALGIKAIVVRTKLKLIQIVLSSSILRSKTLSKYKIASNFLFESVSVICLSQKIEG
jgi:hypothetical protein